MLISEASAEKIKPYEELILRLDKALRLIDGKTEVFQTHHTAVPPTEQREKKIGGSEFEAGILKLVCLAEDINSRLSF